MEGQSYVIVHLAILDTAVIIHTGFSAVHFSGQNLGI